MRDKNSILSICPMATVFLATSFPFCFDRHKNKLLHFCRKYLMSLYYYYYYFCGCDVHKPNRRFCNEIRRSKIKIKHQFTTPPHSLQQSHSRMMIIIVIIIMDIIKWPPGYIRAVRTTLWGLRDCRVRVKKWVSWMI